LRSLSPNVLAFLASEDATTTAINTWLEGVALSPPQLSHLPQATEILEGLWLDTDPNVALWALMVLRQLDAGRAQRLTQTPRTGLPASESLTAFLQGEQLASRNILTAMAEQPLIQRLEPGTLMALPRLCRLQQWRQGDPIERPGGGVLIVLAGRCAQRQSLVPGSAPKTLAEHGPGSSLGLADYFGHLNNGAKTSLIASTEGCTALVFSRTGFTELLDLSPIFEQSLIRELAISCESLQSTLLAERQNKQHQDIRRKSTEL